MTGRSLTFATTMVLLVASAAEAGPDWEEGSLATGDAGAVASSAQFPIGPEGSTLGSITGVLEGLAVETGGPDVQDLYVIFIESPAIFTATTDVAGGGSTAFDSQLWLFTFDELGLLGTDGVSTGATLLSTATDASGAAVTTAGIYYLGISIDPVDPLDAASGPIFSITGPGEISGPDGPGGGSPLADWSAGVPGGRYVIALTGTVFPPDCPADCADGDGEVTTVDLLELLAEFGTAPAHDCDVAPSGGNGAVDVVDLLELLAEWGSCFPPPPV